MNSAVLISIARSATHPPGLLLGNTCFASSNVV
jgi:hypothetical protein